MSGAPRYHRVQVELPADPVPHRRPDVRPEGPTERPLLVGAHRKPEPPKPPRDPERAEALLRAGVALLLAALIILVPLALGGVL